MLHPISIGFKILIYGPYYGRKLYKWNKKRLERQKKENDQYARQYQKQNQWRK